MPNHISRGIGIKGGKGRQDQDGTDQIGTRQEADDSVKHPAQNAADMQHVGHQLEDDGAAIEPQQGIKEPQVRKRKILGVSPGAGGGVPAGVPGGGI